MSTDSHSGFSLTTLPNGWQVGRFDVLGELPFVTHAVTTRRGMDVALVAADPVAAGRQIAEQMGLDAVAVCRQVHGVEIVHADTGGLAGPGDGLVTDRAGLGVMALGADCPLILAAEASGGAVGVAHASWRGTVKRIATRLVEAFTAVLQVDPENLVACIAPSAGPCCYEVGPEVVDVAVRGIGLHAKEFVHEREGRVYLDLWAANRDELICAGVRRDHIHNAGICTICRNDLFPSYRAEGDKAGRFCAVIARSAEARPQNAVAEASVTHTAEAMQPLPC